MNALRCCVFPVIVIALTAVGESQPQHASGDPQPKAVAGKCSATVKHRVLSVNDAGSTIEGPICVDLEVNAVRYTNVLGIKETQTAGQDVTPIFPSAATPSAETRTTPRTRVAEPIDDQIAAVAQQIANLLNGVTSDDGIASRLVDSDDLLDQQQQLISHLTAFVSLSDSLVFAGNITSKGGAIDQSKALSDAIAALPNWPVHIDG